MTCKQCVHHETMRYDAFFCEAYNDLFEEDESFDAKQQCRYFNQISNTDEVQG